MGRFSGPAGIDSALAVEMNARLAAGIEECGCPVHIRRTFYRFLAAPRGRLQHPYGIHPRRPSKSVIRTDAGVDSFTPFPVVLDDVTSRSLRQWMALLTCPKL